MRSQRFCFPAQYFFLKKKEKQNKNWSEYGDSKKKKKATGNLNQFECRSVSVWFVFFIFSLIENPKAKF